MGATRKKRFFFSLSLIAMEKKRRFVAHQKPLVSARSRFSAVLLRIKTPTPPGYSLTDARRTCSDIVRFFRAEKKRKNGKKKKTEGWKKKKRQVKKKEFFFLHSFLLSTLRSSLGVAFFFFFFVCFFFCRVQRKKTVTRDASTRDGCSLDCRVAPRPQEPLGSHR